ncbi:MAG: UbiA family prenyltransferase [Saprospiraceae bacterium]|nr:UbiA family prenyltransferase [Saprospiraceae bacterium]
MKWLKAIVDLVLYGNFWIAICATSCAALTLALSGENNLLSPVNFFVFGGTLFIYGVHRSVGILQLKNFLEEERYSVIYRYRNHIKTYAALGLLVATISLYSLQPETWLALIPLCILSLAYVIPFLQGSKRLRDIHYLKIFLIAICWMGLTAIIPLMELDVEFGPKQTWICIDRFLFILLITLPFDIRDLKVDSQNEVKTLPGQLGPNNTRILGSIITLILLGMTAMAFYHGWISLPVAGTFFSIYILALVLLFLATPDRHDYYYTGLVDGLMLALSLPIIFVML